MQTLLTTDCPKTQDAVNDAVKAGIPLATIMAILAALGANLPALLAFIAQLQKIINPPAPST